MSKKSFYMSKLAKRLILDLKALTTHILWKSN